MFISIAFIDILYKNFREKFIYLIVTPVLIINLIGIYNAHHLPTYRIQYLNRLIDYGRKQENKKFILHDSNFPWQFGWVNWAMPFETDLLSALDGKEIGRAHV